MKLLFSLLALPVLLVGCQTTEPVPSPTVQSAPQQATASKVKAKPSAPTASPKKVKPYPLKTCLVTDEGLDEWDEQTSIVHNNQELKFCCKMCVKKFNKSPQKYLSKLPK